MIVPSAYILSCNSWRIWSGHLGPSVVVIAVVITPGRPVVVVVIAAALSPLLLLIGRIFDRALRPASIVFLLGPAAGLHDW